MTALSTREALARTAETTVGLGIDADPDCSLCGRESHVCPVHYGRAIADALIASGAVVDVTTLADNARLVEAIAADQKEAADSWGDPLPVCERTLRARTALRALATALTERAS